jgi:hypothetical protein
MRRTFIEKEFVIVVQISDECEDVTGGITQRHIGAALNLAEDKDNGEPPLGQIVWAPEFQEGQPDVSDVGWYIVGVRETT